MKKRNSILCLLLLILITLNNLSYAQKQEDTTHKDSTETIQKKAGVGGFGNSSALQLRTDGQISTQRDLVRITYPSTDAKPEETVKPSIVLLIEPTEMNKEGWYIWRDAKGVWNLKCFSGDAVPISGRIATGIDIVDVKRVGQGISTGNESRNILRLSGLVTNEPSVIQFKADGEYVEFDLSFANQRDINKVFLGTGMITPVQIPFRIENKPVMPIVPSSVQTKSKTQLPNQSVGPNSSSSSSSSGGGGGKRP